MRQRIHGDSERLTNLLQYHVLNDIDVLNQSQAFNRLYSQSNAPIFFTNLTRLNQITSQSLNSLNRLPIDSNSIRSTSNVWTDRSTVSRTSNHVWSGRPSSPSNSNALSAKPGPTVAARLLAQLDRLDRNPGQVSLSGSLVLRAKLVQLARPTRSTSFIQHVLVLLVDRVLYPPRSSVFELIATAPMLSTLADLLRVSGLQQQLLIDSRQFTLFAPSNEAFNQLGQATLDQLRRNPETTRGTSITHQLLSFFNCLTISTVTKAQKRLIIVLISPSSFSPTWTRDHSAADSTFVRSGLVHQYNPGQWNRGGQCSR
jgi:uncharacterized surface protein with fasciclin (FAS1) repeats